MSSVGSVTYWIRQLPAGDQAAVQELWERHFQRLVGLARKRLRRTRRGVADEEDVALSAFDSFFRRAREGRFPRLADRHDLWQLLVVIAARKASNLAKHERRRPVIHASALATGNGEEDGSFFADVISKVPDPAFAAQVAEQCERLLKQLGDTNLRDVAVWKLEGYSNKEIEAKLGRSLATVERKLRLIRDTWEREITP
jgi:DNA-directed RNA polymerase specialized sigma24 family protein